MPTFRYRTESESESESTRPPNARSHRGSSLNPSREAGLREPPTEMAAHRKNARRHCSCAFVILKEFKNILFYGFQFISIYAVGKAFVVFKFKKIQNIWSYG